MRASRKIKSALFGGALLTIITVMLMLGSTMAWFQDTEVVINTYTFGNLDVDIVDKNEQIIGATPLQFVKPGGGEYKEGEYLFEPGATFQLKEFYIKNSGDVALKYRLKLDTTNMTEEQLNGIYILPKDTPVGVAVTEVLGLDDVVLEFELTANRGIALVSLV